eukprot:CAMPEP_0184479980 /NCGR_PEP_ID=MMETSP0113_2-20130426/1481_1 /TAXON_ID=91329 /ORGANISM="Norrisiella sphaerica, Strain BC52" /LENGTH=358 /DNA_ID=CAMNT_0026858157 /DNA_START=445 /DNA_END=1521 /DNA_ORIENTATION=+
MIFDPETSGQTLHHNISNLEEGTTNSVLILSPNITGKLQSEKDKVPPLPTTDKAHKEVRWERLRIKVFNISLANEIRGALQFNGTRIANSSGSFYAQHVRKSCGGAMKIAGNTSARFLLNEFGQFPISCLTHERAVDTLFFTILRDPVSRWVSEFHYKRLDREYKISQRSSEEEVLEAVKHWVEDDREECTRPRQYTKCFYPNYYTRLFSGKCECQAFQPENVTGVRIYRHFAGCGWHLDQWRNSSEHERTFLLQTAMETVKKFDIIIPLENASDPGVSDVLRHVGLNVSSDYKVPYTHKPRRAKKWKISNFESVNALIRAKSELDVLLHDAVLKKWRQQIDHLQSVAVSPSAGSEKK